MTIVCVIIKHAIRPKFFYRFNGGDPDYYNIANREVSFAFDDVLIYVFGGKLCSSCLAGNVYPSLPDVSNNGREIVFIVKESYGFLVSYWA